MKAGGAIILLVKIYTYKVLFESCITFQECNSLYTCSSVPDEMYNIPELRVLNHAMMLNNIMMKGCI